MPKLRSLARWMRDRYSLSLHGGALTPPTAMHLRLLGTYRRQLKDIRALLDGEAFAVNATSGGMRASISVGDEPLSRWGESLLRSVHAGHS